MKSVGVQRETPPSAIKRAGPPASCDHSPAPLQHQERTIQTQHEDAITIPISGSEPILLPVPSLVAAYDDETGLPTLPTLLDHLRDALVRLSGQPLTLALLVTEVREVTTETDPELVREVASRLVSSIRGCDIASRIAPGTFALLCEDLGSLDEAIQIAQRVLAGLDEPFIIGERTVTTRANLGVGFPVGEDRADELMRRSLEALHAARLNPRTRYDVILGSPDEPRPLFR